MFGKRLSKFAALPPAERQLLLEAWLWLVVCRLALWFVPFRRLASAPRVRRVPAYSPARLARCVQAASLLVPRPTCLVRAMAAQRLFARHGHNATLAIGVARDRGNFTAHAWLTCDGQTLIGALPDETYTPILSVTTPTPDPSPVSEPRAQASGGFPAPTSNRPGHRLSPSAIPPSEDPV